MSVRSKAVCDLLGVPATTLRLWSNEFSDFLSPSAQASVTEKGTAAQRRYTEPDVAILSKVQELLALGMQYDQIREALANKPVPTDALVALTLSVPSHNGQNAVAVPQPDPIDLSELTSLLTRSVSLQEAQQSLTLKQIALQEEILTELRRKPEDGKPTTLAERLAKRLGI